MAEAGSALFRAIADFTSLTRQGKDAETALRKIREEAGKIGPAAKTSFDGAGREAETFGAKLDRIGGKAESTGKKMSLGLTLPLVAAGGVALKTFVDFDTSIAKTAANAKATGTEFDALKEKALDLGAETKFSASEAAGAMYELSSAGISVKDIMGGAVDSVLLLATATGGDLAQSAELVAGAMNAFGISAGDSAHVADVLTQAISQSALDITDLQQALASAGQAGATANQDLESVVSVVEAMVKNAVPAAQAGTGLSQALQSLKAPLVKGRAVMEDFGIEVRDANGEMLQLPQIIKNVEDGLADSNPKFAEAAEAAGMTGQEFRDMKLDALFGVEGMKVMGVAMGNVQEISLDTAEGMESMAQLTLGLTKVMGKDAADAFIAAHVAGDKFVATGADSIIALDAMNRGADGVAASFAEKLGGTTGAKLESLKGTIETLAIRIIDTVVPALDSMLDKVIPVVNAIADFAKAHPGITQLGVAFAGVLAILGPTLYVFGKMAKGLSDIIKFGKGAVRVLARVALGKVVESPIEGISAGRKGGLKGAAQKISSSVVNSVKALGSAVKTVGVESAKAARAVARMVVQLARTAAAGLAKGVRALASAFVTLGKAAVRAMIAIGRAMLANPWILVIIAVIAAIVLVIKHWETIHRFLVAVWGAIQRAASDVWQTIQRVFDTVLNAIKETFNTVWGAIKSIIATVFEVIKTIIETYVNIWRTIIETVLNVIWTIITTIWNAIRTVIETVIGAIRLIIETVWGVIRSVTETVWNAISAVISGVWDTIKSVVETGINAVKAILDTVFGLIQTAWDGFWGGLKNTLGAIWEGIKAAVVAGINLVIGVLNGLIGAANAVLSILPGGFKISTIGTIASGSAKGTGSQQTGGRGMGQQLNRGGEAVPGQGNVDSVHAVLTPGEFVVRRDTVKKIGLPAMQALNAYGRFPAQKRNRGGRIRRYALGGLVDGIPGSGVIGDGLDLAGDAAGAVAGGARAVAGGAKDLVVGGINLAGDLVEQAARKGAVTVFNAAASFAQKAVDNAPFSNSMPMQVARGSVAKIIDSARSFIQGKEAEEQQRVGALTGGSTTGLVPEFARAFQAYAGRFGFRIGSGFRSSAQQAVLYDRWVRRVPGQAQAAPPGRSNHERGLAIDHTPHSNSASRAAASQYGLRYPMSFEPWHVEPISIGVLKSMGYHMGGIAKYHSGGVVKDGVSLNSKEVLARLERGEGVLSTKAMTRLASGVGVGGSPSISSRSSKGGDIKMVVHNPVAERASTSLYRTAQRVQVLGLLDTKESEGV